MTFSLSDVRGTRRDLPVRSAFHGIHKVGKTTLAAGCPGVIFIPTEDGQDSVDAATFPLCKTWGDVLSAIGVLYMEKHDYKAVCLDSGDWAELLAREQVCRDTGVVSISEGNNDFGKGYQRAADLFKEMLDGLNALRTDKGMDVIMLVHTEIKRFDDPLAESYDRYQIKLHKHINKLVQEWADVIGFCQADTVIKKEEKDFSKEKRARAIDMGTRSIHFERSAAYDAGNRFGLPAKIDMNWASYQEALDAAKNTTPTTNQKDGE